MVTSSGTSSPATARGTCGRGGGGGGDPPLVDSGGDGDPPPVDVGPAPEHDREEWLKIELDDARFILDPYSMSIGCHCKTHRNCRVNKVVTKMPVGYFMAWLAAAGRFASRDEHFRARTWTEDKTPDGFDTVVSFVQRDAGREAAKADPSYARLLSWEVPEGTPEPEKLG